MARTKATHERADSTRGWGKSSPDTVSARRKLAKRCGVRRAFLLPNASKPGYSKFPVIAKHSQACAYDCRGLWTAKQRAAQTGRGNIERKATRLAKRAGCDWARGE